MERTKDGKNKKNNRLRHAREKLSSSWLPTTMDSMVFLKLCSSFLRSFLRSATNRFFKQGSFWFRFFLRKWSFLRPEKHRSAGFWEIPTEAGKHSGETLSCGLLCFHFGSSSRPARKTGSPESQRAQVIAKGYAKVAPHRADDGLGQKRFQIRTREP